MWKQTNASVLIKETKILKFRAVNENPYHLSVGVILKTEEGWYVLHRRDDVYSCVTGTVDDNESLEECVHREVMEEMGVTCSIDSYAGGTICTVADQRGTFQKTTVWFMCTKTSEYGMRTDDLDASVVEIPEEGLCIVDTDLPRWPTHINVFSKK